jgi:hypothetical protein
VQIERLFGTPLLHVPLRLLLLLRLVTLRLFEDRDGERVDV